MLRLACLGNKKAGWRARGAPRGVPGNLNGLKDGQFHGLSVMYRATASARERTCIFS
jgi:hypothetical protein